MSDISRNLLCLDRPCLSETIGDRQRDRAEIVVRSRRKDDVIITLRSVRIS